MGITDAAALWRRGQCWRVPAIFAALALAPLSAAAEALAFPGAEGYGASAIGWQGGQIIAVTTLDDHGPGSLRACAETDHPRICIFQLSGTIRLDGPIMVRSNVYIAGQTAPGDGIQLRVGRSDHGPLIVKNAHDVVIRFLKLRPGTGGAVSANIDALTIENASRIYLGNLSMAFASDETFNIHVASGSAQDITLADSILAYSLDRANHPKGAHSKGALICSDEGRDFLCGRVSLLRNLFAHHRDRNPDIKSTGAGPVEVINNIFYNPISQFGEIYDLIGEVRLAYIGNLALTGPSTTARAAHAVEAFDWADNAAIHIWQRDNLAYRWADCETRVPIDVLDPEAQGDVSAKPIPITITPMPAAQLETALPPRIGDVLPGGGHRDALDQRTLDDLKECTGQVINSVDEVGGWPEIATVPAPQDSDGDLLPDRWEAAHPGLDPARANDPWADADGDGIASVENWLADLAGDR